MLAFPNAKINIGLNITEKRPDGFHNIESVFYPLQLSDILEVVKTEGQEQAVSFTSTGIEIPGNSADNLCVKAYQLLAADFQLSPVKIHLHKIIPIGAGLGGGSSDAVSCLKLLNQIFELNLNDDQLIVYAKQLGSDCAFFVTNQPVFAHGKGDEFDEVKVKLKRKFLVLVYPKIQVDTGEAYSMVVPTLPDQSLKESIQKPIRHWSEWIVNDFEQAVMGKYPVIGEVKQELLDRGAVYASMTGSGSAVFGIFDEQAELEDVFSDYFVWTEVME